jgi:polyhydroxyalkanoate synthesis regulator phasin
VAKDKKKQQPSGDPLRSAAQALESAAAQAGFTRERAEQMVDELAHAAARFRETIEELRPAGGDELRDLRERIAALEERVATLEKKPAPKRSAAKRAAPAKRSSS